MKGSAIPARTFTGPAPVPNNTWIVDLDSLQTAVQILDLNTADSGRAAAGWPAGWLRPGLVLGKITTGGKVIDYDDDGTDDGRRTAIGILLDPVKLTDDDGVALTGSIHVRVVIAGRVRSAGLIGCDAAAIVELKARGFIFEDTFEATS